MDSLRVEYVLGRIEQHFKRINNSKHLTDADKIQIKNFYLKASNKTVLTEKPPLLQGGFVFVFPNGSEHHDVTVKFVASETAPPER